MGNLSRFIREHFLPSKIDYPEKTNHFEIYQIKPTPDARKCMYMNLSMIDRMGYVLSKDIYTLVYTDIIKNADKLSTRVFLEDIFTKFNLDRPRNFRGRSMSVSDIIVMYINGEKTTYYVDGSDFARLPNDFWET